MAIEARDLQSWIGNEVLGSSGEKLGKLEEVYFRGSEPLAVSIRSGLGGRKHHTAVLRGATVSRDCLQLDATAETIVSSDGAGLGAEQLARLAAHDDRLHGVQPDDVEGWTAREERLKAQGEAQAKADKLEQEAQLHGKDEDAAKGRARDADHEAEEARRAREEAEAQAQAVRPDADSPG